MTALPSFPTIQARPWLIPSEITSQAVVSASITCHVLSGSWCCRRRGIIRLAYRSFERTCEAFDILFCTCVARFSIFTTVETVGAAGALSLTALTRFLEFRGDDVLAVNTGVVACCARIVVIMFNEGAVIVATFKACFAASALGMTNCQLVNCESILSAYVLASTPFF